MKHFLLAGMLEPPSLCRLETEGKGGRRGRRRKRRRRERGMYFIFSCNGPIIAPAAYWFSPFHVGPSSTGIHHVNNSPSNSIVSFFFYNFLLF